MQDAPLNQAGQEIVRTLRFLHVSLAQGSFRSRQKIHEGSPRESVLHILPRQQGASCIATRLSARHPTKNSQVVGWKESAAPSQVKK